MTTDPKPEQLKALADRLEIDAGRTDVSKATRHLRAYAEQISFYAKSKRDSDDMVKGLDLSLQLTQLQAKEYAELKNQLAQRDARIKKLEACCAEMRELITMFQLQVVPGSGLPSKYTVWIASALSTDCGKDLLAQHEAWRKALEEIASFKEGPEVTSSFDEPGSAAIARAALNPTVSGHTAGK